MVFAAKAYAVHDVTAPGLTLNPLTAFDAGAGNQFEQFDPLATADDLALTL